MFVITARYLANLCGSLHTECFLINYSYVVSLVVVDTFIVSCSL